MQHGWCSGSELSPGSPRAGSDPGDNPVPTGTCTKPSAAGGEMQQIKLEKVKCSHSTPITFRVCGPIPRDEDEDVQAQDKTTPPPQLLQAPQKQEIRHFCRSCQDPDPDFSSLGLFSHSPAPSVSFPNTRQAKHYFTILAFGTQFWASVSACHWRDK